jgi:hypothetical protein
MVRRLFAGEAGSDVGDAADQACTDPHLEPLNLAGLITDCCRTATSAMGAAKLMPARLVPLCALGALCTMLLLMRSGCVSRRGDAQEPAAPWLAAAGQALAPAGQLDGSGTQTSEEAVARALAAALVARTTAGGKQFVLASLVRAAGLAQASTGEVPALCAATQELAHARLAPAQLQAQ